MRAALTGMGTYPSDGYRLVSLEADASPALYDGVTALIAEQAAEEGRSSAPVAAPRLRELTKGGSGALLHALLGPEERVSGYQLSNDCRTLGGHYAYINETYITRERRGLGLGFVLLKLYLEWARSRGFTHVYSHTGSPEMKRVAERLGAKVQSVDWVDFPLDARGRP